MILSLLLVLHRQHLHRLKSTTLIFSKMSALLAPLQLEYCVLQVEELSLQKISNKTITPMQLRITNSIEHLYLLLHCKIRFSLKPKPQENLIILISLLDLDHQYLCNNHQVHSRFLLNDSVALIVNGFKEHKTRYQT